MNSRCSHRVRWREALIRLLGAFVIIVVAFSVQAQQPHNTAIINGTIYDAGGHPLAGIVVTLQAGSQILRQEHTEAKGQYTFDQLPAGNYTVRAEGSASVPGSSSTSFSVKDAETKTADLVLGSTDRQKPEFYEEPTFTVAGVSESSGAGVHASDSAMRNADVLAKATASLERGASPTGSALPADATTIEHLQKLIATNDQAQLHNQLGHAEEISGHSLDALREFQRAAEMDPSEPNLFDWGTELLVHHAAEPAADIFAKGNRLYPHSVRMLTGLAVAEYARGAYNAAVDRLCKASDLDPHDRTPYTFLGKMENAEVKRSPNALAKLARYAELFPDDASANYLYAVALWNQPAGTGSNDARVEQLLRKSIAIDPEFGLAYMQIGILETSRARFQEAASSYEKAIAIDSSLEEAHYRLAQTYRRMGQEAKARHELEIYQHLADTTNENAINERKTLQQFVYELKTPAPPAEAH
jgi:tetratricopeptide (TPR) repeat protein